MRSSVVAVEVEVEYDYEAEFCDELTIRQGEVITNVKQMSGGWWEGTHPSGKHGLFPENFVKVVAGVTTTESSSDVELRKGKRCRVLFSYRPSHEDELELKPNEVIDFICEVEDGWWRGKAADGAVGVFPSNFVELVSKTTVAAAATPTKTDTSSPTPTPPNNETISTKNKRNETNDVNGKNTPVDIVGLNLLEALCIYINFWKSD